MPIGSVIEVKVKNMARTTRRIRGKRKMMNQRRM